MFYFPKKYIVFRKTCEPHIQFHVATPITKRWEEKMNLLIGNDLSVAICSSSLELLLIKFRQNHLILIQY